MSASSEIPRHSEVLEPHRLRHPHHKLPGVFTAEQHAEPDGRLFETLQHVELLTHRSIAQTRCEPGACFVVTIAIVENEKALHASMHGSESTEVAYGVRFGGMRLRDAAAQNHTRVLAQMHERCIERGAADIVEVEIHTVRASARNGVR